MSASFWYLADVVVAHALEEIVVLVVFADMIEAVAPVILLAAAALGRAMRRLVAGSPAIRRHARSCARRRSAPGFTRMLSNNGESNFMTGRLCGHCATNLQVLTITMVRIDSAPPGTAAIDASTMTMGMRRYAVPKMSSQKKLTEAFAPESLDVDDESHLHEGHAGPPAGRPDAFPGLYRVGGLPRQEPDRAPSPDQCGAGGGTRRQRACAGHPRAGAGRKGGLTKNNRPRNARQRPPGIARSARAPSGVIRNDGDAVAALAQHAEAEAVEGEALAHARGSSAPRG